MKSFIALGKKIYDTGNPREIHRLAVFIVRCWLNHGSMRELDRFFQQNELLKQVAESFPFLYEQPTRAFFFHRSTVEERVRLVKEHMEFLQERLRPEAMLRLYQDGTIPLWEMDLDGESLRLVIRCEPGQRKEGLAAVMLWLGGEPLYQIMFWIAKDKKGEWAFFIGALQGPNMEDAREIIKHVTKKCHAYRTKNLILYGAQAVARSLGISHIYGVTNEGYYANNHVRKDRKLKTSFSDFWMEAGGWHTEDSRFDELPLREPRKSEAEIPTRKRAVYRRRFALLDEIDAAIEASMAQVLK